MDEATFAGGQGYIPNSGMDFDMPQLTSDCKVESLEMRIKQEVDDEAEESVNLDSPFPFETEQVALKDNRDYQNLIRALVVLEAQRTTALRDYETLLQLQHQALQNPIAFVHKLQQKVDLGMSKPQRVAELPNIPWEEYSVSLKGVFDPYGARHLTRQKYKREIIHNMKEDTDDMLLQPEEKVPVALSSLDKSCKVDDDVIQSMGGNASNDKCNGRGTFNQPWSVDEQKHLEALLLKYPPERFESRRWVKIANELGNRTPQQVASRVQKYFIKLAKLSLPIPGRMPNLATYGGKGSCHKHQKYNRFYFPSSTFMTSYEPTVFMAEEENEAGANCYWNETLTASHVNQQASFGEEFYSDYEGRPELTKDSLEYKDISLAMSHEFVCPSEQKCILCGYIINDICWHCIECPVGRVILCTVCSKQEFIKGGHSSKHLLSRIRCQNSSENFSA